MGPWSSDQCIFCYSTWSLNPLSPCLPDLNNSISTANSWETQAKSLWTRKSPLLLILVWGWKGSILQTNVRNKQFYQVECSLFQWLLRLKPQGCVWVDLISLWAAEYHQVLATLGASAQEKHTRTELRVPVLQGSQDWNPRGLLNLEGESSQPNAPLPTESYTQCSNNLFQERALYFSKCFHKHLYLPFILPTAKKSCGNRQRNKNN